MIKIYVIKHYLNMGLYNPFVKYDINNLEIDILT